MENDTRNDKDNPVKFEDRIAHKKNNLVETIVLVVVFVVAFVVLDRYTNLFGDKKENNMANVPDKTQDINDGYGGPEEPKIADISTTTIESINLYDPKNYENSSTNVAFKGEFETAELHIEGSIKNDFINFLFIGFGTTNGTYGVERLSQNQIKYEPDAVFSKDEAINLSIDLMSEIKLSNSIREIKQGSGSSKSRRLWDFIQPPSNINDASKVKLVVGFYDQNGSFEGSEITKLQILYRCKESDPNCKVGLCSRQKFPDGKGSACLDELFGAGSGNNYGNYFKALIKN